MRRWNRRWALAALLLLAGCGGGLRRLPDSALAGLPPDGRRWIFDAENAIVVALDGVDLVKEAVRDEETQVARAQRSLKAAQQQERQRGTDLGVQAAQARLDLAVLRRRLAERKLGIARLKAQKARADLELDKARQVVLYDLVAMRGFRLQPFTVQAQQAAQQVEEAQRQMEAMGKKLVEQEARLYEARQKYIAKTGDHDSGVWLD